MEKKTFKCSTSTFTLTDEFFIGYLKSRNIQQLETLNFNIKKLIHFKKKCKENKIKNLRIYK